MDELRNALSAIKDLLQIAVLVLTARQLTKKDKEARSKSKRRRRR